MNRYIFDCEVFPNFYLISFLNLEDQTILDFSTDSVLTGWQISAISEIFHNNITIGFNSKNYDFPVTEAALEGKTSQMIYIISKTIIESNKRINICHYNHIDLFPVVGSKTGLKTLGCRMGSEKLQDLPLDPHREITDAQKLLITDYCHNDLYVTYDLYMRLEKDLLIREALTKTYKTDLRSSSDSQITEKIYARSVYRDRTELINNIKLSRLDYLKFSDEKLTIFHNKILESSFSVVDGNKIISPDWLGKKHNITINKSTYTFGGGGLHSTEKTINYKSNDDCKIVNIDVQSYYPALIINNDFFPSHMKQYEKNYFKESFNKRLKLKAEADPTTEIERDGLKIQLNSFYGKFSDIFSCLFDLKAALNTRLNGQLTLLMLIDMLEAANISVISANTDGLTLILYNEYIEQFNSICRDWENITNLSLSKNEYKAVYYRDVNSYIAIDYNNKFTTIGHFASPSLARNANAQICVTAVKEYLLNKTPINKTIKECKDVKQFIMMRKVTDGAIYQGYDLGQNIRWIYDFSGGVITYKKNGNKVAESDHARPLMDLRHGDIKLRYDIYINRAVKQLLSLGVACERISA